MKSTTFKNGDIFDIVISKDSISTEHKNKLKIFKPNNVSINIKNKFNFFKSRIEKIKSF